MSTLMKGQVNTEQETIINICRQQQLCVSHSQLSALRKFLVFQMFVMQMCCHACELVLVSLLPLPQALRDGLLHDCTMCSAVDDRETYWACNRDSLPSSGDQWYFSVWWYSLQTKLQKNQTSIHLKIAVIYLIHFCTKLFIMCIKNIQWYHSNLKKENIWIN